MGSVSEKWDICAGQAIIKCLAGNLTDLKGNELIYDKNTIDFKNKYGIVCSLDKRIHELIIK